MQKTPGEELVNNLDRLRLELNRLVDRLQKSGIERTNGLRTMMGPDCEFYQKSLSILVRKDYQDLKNLVANCHSLFQLVENNGKESS